MASFRRFWWIGIVVLLAGAGSFVQIIATPPAVPAQTGVTIQAAGRGNPWINFADGREIPADYSGSAAAESAIASSGARGLALASADFDEDGMPDLVASYDTPAGGLLSLHFGNVDAVYPNAPEAKKRRAEGKFVDSPFLPDAKVFETLERPDFIGAGDFDADGHWDVVAARKGGDKLALHRGDGAGGLLPPESLPLPGAATVLATGDVNRRDGLEDVLVGVAMPSGARLLVFEWPEGALSGKPEEIELPEPATSIVAGQIDDHYAIDMVVAAGKYLVAITGRDRGEAATARGEAPAAPLIIVQHLPFEAISVALLNGPKASGVEVGILDQAGNLHAAIAGSSAVRDIEVPASPVGTVLLPARVSTASGEDLLLVRRSPASVLVVTGEPLEGAQELDSTAGLPARPRSCELSGGVDLAAAIPMRLNKDALTDVVLLGKSAYGLASLETAPLSIFQVTNMLAGYSSEHSLDWAISQQNLNPGHDEITFNIPGPGPYRVPLTGSAGTLYDASIDATTQPGYAGTPLIEIYGGISGPSLLYLGSGDNMVRGLVVQSFGGEGVHLHGSCIFEGNYVGVDPGGLVDRGNDIGIHVISGSSDSMTIGGTVAPARNVIAGNDVDVVCGEPGLVACGNLRLLGNYIGLAANGATRLDGGGVLLDYFATNATIGGTAPGSRNFMAAPGPVVRLAGDSSFGEMSGHLIQGNSIGLNAAGTSALGPATVGVKLVNAHHNTIGGTSLPARNVIAGHSDAAVLIEESASVANLVQGNRLGASAAGTIPIPNHTGVRAIDAPGTVVGGLAGGAGNHIKVGDTGTGLGCCYGVRYDTVDGGLVAGNLIGTNGAGTAALGPAEGAGIQIRTGSTNNIIRGNVVSNSNTGIAIYGAATSSNQVSANLIGTDYTGTAPIPNLGKGVDVAGATSNLIGGTTLADGNIIRFNGGIGVEIDTELGMGGVDNTVRFNSILDNGSIGIDLQGDGVPTLNDPDDTDGGANEGQNFPVLSLATTTGRSVRLVGTLKSNSSRDYQLDFYTSSECDPSGHGEGGRHIATAMVHTNGAGDALFTSEFAATVFSGESLTATATTPSGDTSEFSACQGAFGVPPGAIFDLGFSTGADIAWSDVPGADFYHFHVGTLSTLSGLATPVADSCEAAVIDTPGGTLPPASNPPPGQMLWFLATAEGLYGEGPVQPSSQKPRELTSTGGCEDSCVHSVCDVGGPLVPACALCASIVCDKDPTCCSGAWSANCVQNVRTVCRSLSCAASTGQCPHSLCETGQPLPVGCDAPPLPVSCTATVCQALPHCCSQAWDESCLDMMSRTCGYNCI